MSLQEVAAEAHMCVELGRAQGNPGLVAVGRHLCETVLESAVAQKDLPSFAAVSVCGQ